MKNVTEQDLLMLKFFWEEKGDITRYNWYKDIKDDLKERYPQVVKAWEDYQTSIKIMDSVMKCL